MDANTELNTPEMAQQRVDIAKDVIAQLNAKRMIATEGEYLPSYRCDENDLQRVGIFIPTSLNQEISEMFKTRPIACECCAKGAIFVAAVERFNNITLGEYQAKYMDGTDDEDEIEADFSDHDMCLHLVQYFTKYQLDLIETAFEGSCISQNEIRRVLIEGLGTPDCDEVEFENRFYALITPATEFYNRFNDPSDRMIGIMENIIANNGTFAP